MERDKDKNEQKFKNQDTRLTPPEIRIKTCFDSGKNFPFDHNTSIIRYYRSGKEIIRQAEVYMREGDLEKAYILYIRYITIFVEKLEAHPEYNSIPLDDKIHIKNTLRDIFPKTEALKKKLLEIFQTEYDKRKKEVEEQERLEAERRKILIEKQRLKEEEERKYKISGSSVTKVPSIAAAAVSDELRSKRQVLPQLPQTNYIKPHSDEQPQHSRERKVPSVDRSTKPTSLTSGDRLRDMIIPGRLMENFLKLASNNTYNNIETCGILAGRLERNKLLVTHFLIPKQTGSPDSCTTHNEEDIFNYQDQHALITLGWIHTHPTQTAFLSSVDLHTHCAYQLMMAEAIAIVCAPKYDKTGFFHLTPDYGLNFIANCREVGFHPHPNEPPLFTSAKHFKLDPMASIEAVDLRRK